QVSYLCFSTERIRGAPGPRFWDLGGNLPLLPFPSRPERLDLDRSFHSCGIVPITGPWPLLRFLDQSASDGIAVHVTQFLNLLCRGEYVEVVVSRLPEWALLAAHGHR